MTPCTELHVPVLNFFSFLYFFEKKLEHHVWPKISKNVSFLIFRIYAQESGVTVQQYLPARQRLKWDSMESQLYLY